MAKNNETTGGIGNLTQLREAMAEMLEEARAGKRDVMSLVAVSGLGGTIIKSVSVQLDYAKARKERPNIPFAK